MRADPRKLRPSTTLLIIAGALTAHFGCAADDGEGSGNGSDGPVDLQSLDSAAPTISRDLDEAGELIRYNASQFSVKQGLTLVFSSRTPDNGFDGFRGETVDEIRDVIYAFDYGTGVFRQLVRAPNEGRLVFPLPVSVDRGLVYYATVAEDAESMRVRGLDPESGALTSETEIGSVYGSCFVAAGGDLYFDPGGLSVVTARDFPERDLVSSVDASGGPELCRRSGDLVALDGTAVLVEAPNDLDPSRETIRLVALDPASGTPEPTPLLTVPVSSVTLGTEGERPPVLAVEDDGLYVLASDFLAIEVWFVPYDRRPGEAPGSGSTEAPERLARIEVPFFAEVIPTEGGLAVFDPVGFAAVDGVIAMAVVIEESAGSGRFFWGYLVIIDTPNELVDLLLFSNANVGIADMLPTGE